MTVDDLSDASALTERGFGHVASVPGFVYFFDPGTGRVAELNSTTNTLRELVSITATTTGDALGGLAVTDESIWLRTGTRSVRALDRTTLTLGTEIDLGVAFTSPPYLLAKGERVWATGIAGREVVLVEISPTPAFAPRELGALDELVAVAIDGTHVWASSGNRVVIAPIDYSEGKAKSFETDRPIMALDAFDASAYGLDDQGAIVAIDTDGRTATITDPLVPVASRPIREPAQVIAGSNAVHVLVRDDPDVEGQRVRVSRIAFDGTILASIRLPSDVFIGRMAIS